jgi:hypothetical protein
MNIKSAARWLMLSALLFIGEFAMAQHQVILNWNAPAANSTNDPPASYTVSRAPVVGGVIGTYSVIAQDVAATTYTDTTVAAGDVYEYSVESVNSAGVSTGNPVLQLTIPINPPAPPTGLTGTPS